VNWNNLETWFWLGSHDWGPILNCADIQCAYDLFLETVKFFIQTCIPAKLVRLRRMHQRSQFERPVCQSDFSDDMGQDRQERRR
jgi:hypothetical protein